MEIIRFFLITRKNNSYFYLMIDFTLYVHYNKFCRVDFAPIAQLDRALAF